MIVSSILLFSPSASSQAGGAHPSVTGHLSLYVDGALQTSTQCPSAWQATGHTAIGRSLFGGKPTDFVHGLLGDVRVYDQALTASQIKTLYAQGPQADWHFNRTQVDQTRGGAADTPDQWQLQGGVQLPSDQGGPLSLSGTGAFADVGRAALDTTKSYTVSAWVSLSSTDGFQTLVSQDGKAVSGFFLQKRGDSNKFALAIYEADDPDAPHAVAESSSVPQANTLYHVVGVFSAGPAVAAPPPPAPPAPVFAPPLPWDAGRQGWFLESLAQDRQGHVWVATEGNGVWRYDPASPAGQQWTQFTQKDGLGSDDVYALLIDGRNRVWAGTLHGVSVYDGKTWKTYGPLEGLSGFRVFALASCPNDGDVWIATEGGLTRYSLKADRWQQYSRLDGLPSDAVQCLVFSKTGDLYVGMQCDGIAVASPRSNYKTWRVACGPASLPEAAGGAGLPTSLINCLYVAHDGTVYAGTTTGLARSSDGGKTWRFLRGADWPDKRDGQHPQSWLDEGLVNLANVRAIEVLPRRGAPVRVAAGGPGAEGWQADHGFTGGQSWHTGDPLDSSAVGNPAPQSVYQYGRFGSFVYTIPGLAPGVSCRVRLHMADVDFDKPGQRVFNVAVNGRRVLTHEDIVAEAGAKDKVIVKEFTVPADAQGRIVLAFRGSGPLPSLDRHSPYELSEDYVTALAEDGAGHLLVGHRQTGVEMLDPATGKRVSPKADASPATDIVTSFQPRPDGTLLVAGYGTGLSQMPIVGTTHDGVFAQAPSSPAALPSPEPPPTLVELNAMLRTASAVAPDKDELAPKVVTLEDDWLTQGDWLGRYGRYWACLNAMCSPDNYQWGAGWEAVSYSSRIGPHATSDDGLRYWVQWLYTEDPRVLEMPPTYLDSRVRKGLTTPDRGRRESEIDDHGEAYQRYMEGPNLYTTLRVPRGLFILSLYDVNYNAHDGGSVRDRDYWVSVRPHPGAVPLKDVSRFNQQPELARERIQGFYGGVWKRFLVRGPQELTVEINRNGSCNTMLPAVMLDLVDQLPPPYFETVINWKNLQAAKEKQRQRLVSQGFLASLHPATTEKQAVDRLQDVLATAQEANSTWWAINSRRFYVPLLRWYAAQPATVDAALQAHLASGKGACDYALGLYQDWEQCQRQQGLQTARDIEKSLRWDGTSDVGQGFQVVTSYLSSHSGKKLGERIKKAEQQ